MANRTVIISAAAATPRPVARHRGGAMATVFVVAAVLVSACGTASTGSAGSSSASAPTVSNSPTVTATGALLATASTALGTILVDGQGKAVYLFGADSAGSSTCTGTCAQYWPPVPAPASLPASLSGVNAQLGEITRADGSKQLTVGGWPVYTYAADTANGVPSGQGQNLSGGLWWVVSAAGSPVKTAASASSSPTPSSSKSKTSTKGGWA